MSSKRQALMDSVSDRDARREAMMSMMKSTDEKIEALLTPDQKDKYEALIKAREAMMRQRMN
jgi:Spy/CpxP family protein refolding chaperone